MGPSEDWIHRLQLEPHPEGGHFRRVYTDPRPAPGAAGARVWASAIHYLLTPQSPLGALHRNRSTILHFLQDGGPVEYVVLDAQGGLQRTVLGFEAGQALFLAVPGGCWKASRLTAGAAHALVGEVVMPGFDYADHEFMTAAQLQSQYPQQAAALAALLRPVPGATSR